MTGRADIRERLLPADDARGGEKVDSIHLNVFPEPRHRAGSSASGPRGGLRRRVGSVASRGRASSDSSDTDDGFATIRLPRAGNVLYNPNEDEEEEGEQESQNHKKTVITVDVYEFTRTRHEVRHFGTLHELVEYLASIDRSQWQGLGSSSSTSESDEALAPKKKKKRSSTVAKTNPGMVRWIKINERSAKVSHIIFLLYNEPMSLRWLCGDVLFWQINM